ncbi:MAG: hypothetical protein AB7D06_14345 [Pedobacter sp.]
MIILHAKARRQPAIFPTGPMVADKNIGYCPWTPLPITTDKQPMA